MIIRIGVGDVAKEIQLEMGEDTDLSSLKSNIDNAISSSEGILWQLIKMGER